MLRTMVARQVRDELFTSEASLEQALKDANGLLATALEARLKLGVIGTLGDAAEGDLRRAIAALAEAKAALTAGHDELYSLMGKLDIRGVAVNPKVMEGSLEEQNRAA